MVFIARKDPGKLEGWELRGTVNRPMSEPKTGLGAWGARSEPGAMWMGQAACIRLPVPQQGGHPDFSVTRLATAPECQTLPGALGQADNDPGALPSLSLSLLRAGAQAVPAPGPFPPLTKPAPPCWSPVWEPLQ